MKILDNCNACDGCFVHGGCLDYLTGGGPKSWEACIAANGVDCSGDYSV